MPRKRTTAGDLVIVESPAMTKNVERYPGPGFHVMASHGRVRDLAKGI
jgi:DNA topoisomerase IA